jgi:hypothetical protein
MEAQKIIFLVFPNMDNVSVAQVTLALWSSAFVAGAKSVTAQRTPDRESVWCGAEQRPLVRVRAAFPASSPAS